MTAWRQGWLRWALPVLAAIIGGCAASTPEAPDTHLRITSEPEQGARIVLDGQEVGETPFEVTGIRPGPIFMLLEREGYKPQGRNFIVQEGDGPQDVVVTLEPRVGFLSVESEPFGAEVVLDEGRVLGQTPLVNAQLPIGEHAYELRLENYHPARRELTVEEDFRYSFRHILEPLQAELVVMSRPTNAVIWINDERQVERTPARFQLRPGHYTVGVQTRGFILAERTVSLDPNQEHRVEIAMIAGNVPEGMVIVPEGEFIMGESDGAPDERPRRKVHLPTFYIDKYAVTNEEFQRVFPSHSFPRGRENFPVTGVTFQQASDYANRVGKRLPTEAEWEKAARGTDGREYPWGNEFNPEFANSQEAGHGRPVPVSRFREGASPYGVMNMAGNVYEWTSNWYEAYPGNTDVTREYGQVYRVLRGGSYRTDRYHVRCARRHFDRMDANRGDYGFRCAMSADE